MYMCAPQHIHKHVKIDKCKKNWVHGNQEENVGYLGLSEEAWIIEMRCVNGQKISARQKKKVQNIHCTLGYSFLSQTAYYVRTCTLRLQVYICANITAQPLYPQLPSKITCNQNPIGNPASRINGLVSNKWQSRESNSGSHSKETKGIFKIKALN